MHVPLHTRNIIYCTCMHACMHTPALRCAHIRQGMRALAQHRPHICADSMRDARTLTTSCTHLCIHPNAHTTHTRATMNMHANAYAPRMRILCVRALAPACARMHVNVRAYEDVRAHARHHPRLCAGMRARTDAHLLHASMRIFFHACTTTRYNMHAHGHAAQSSMRTQHAHHARICALRHCIIPTDAQICTYSRTYATSYTAHACMDAHSPASMRAYSPSHARACATSSPHMRRYAQICAMRAHSRHHARTCAYIRMRILRYAHSRPHEHACKCICTAHAHTMCARTRTSMRTHAHACT